MLRQQFPHQTLEDKGILRGGGNDRKQVHEPRRSAPITFLEDWSCIRQELGRKVTMHFAA